MKILSKKKWQEIDDLVTNLQKDYNNLRDKQIDMQLDLSDMRQQKELAEAQVEYLRKEIAKLKGEKKGGNKERKIIQKK